MFLPLADNNPYRRIVQPYVTYTLIGLNVAIFLMTTGWCRRQSAQANALGLGLIPAIFTDGAMLAPNLAGVPSWATWLTYMFMHGGWMHLIGNMPFLWVFADNVEDAMGHARSCLLSDLRPVRRGGASLRQCRLAGPLVGASGAISGVLAAYLCSIRGPGLRPRLQHHPDLHSRLVGPGHLGRPADHSSRHRP